MMSSSGILTINLSAIQSNWHYVVSVLSGNAECAAVVKANAYGMGAAEVVKALYERGCKHFFVVTLDEALELRGVLPDDAILYVLGGLKEGAESFFVEFNLIPVLYSLRAISRWLDFCQIRNSAFPCAIKLDTGMTRLGMSLEDLDVFSQKIAFKSLLNPVLFMSHLACADERGHLLNQLQLERFTTAATKIRNYFPTIKLSLANSSGVFLGPEYHFDMVRIGAALYGINPQHDNPNPLQPSINLKLPVLQVRELGSPATVGYGAIGKAEAGARLAVVAGGYADGIHRTLGLNPVGQIEGVEVRAKGRISMDSCVFDISASPTTYPNYIEVINNELTLDKLITENKTLGYEVITSLGQRYKREYLYLESTHE
ncbi:MAG: alanine racemase [Cellvibrio sp.]